MRARALLLVSMMVAVAGCGSDEPWTSGSKLEADVFDDGEGARTLIDFRLRATNRACTGIACGDGVVLTQSFRDSGLEGISMQGLEGDDGSWMFENLWDVERGGPCTFLQYGDTYRCGFVQRFPAAYTRCDAYAFACDPASETCREGALVLLMGEGYDETFYAIGAKTDAAPIDCTIDFGCPGCEARALVKVDPETLPEAHTRWVGTGRYQVESWSDEDGSWTIPKRTRELRDMGTGKPCFLDRASPDADAVCTP